MSPSAGAPQGTTNYLVPSSGGTHAVPFEGVFSATPYVIDWRQFNIDQFPFQPQGVFIDNTAGAGDLTLTIQPIGWNVVCPAGAQKTANFPAPNNLSCQITGDGQATIVFVDFPVLPDAGAVTVENTVSVDIVSPDPVPVSPTVNSSGTPYQNTEVPAVAIPMYNGTITGAAVSSGNITPAQANLNLRNLVLALSGAATLAAAGNNLITATLNGTVVYKENVYIPAAAGWSGWSRVLDWEKIGLGAANGSLVVTVATALATGVLDINAYFA
jgi:hypothetical protein